MKFYVILNEYELDDIKQKDFHIAAYEWSEFLDEAKDLIYDDDQVIVELDLQIKNKEIPFYKKEVIPEKISFKKKTFKL